MKNNVGFTYGQLEKLKELEQMSIANSSAKLLPNPLLNAVADKLSKAQKELIKEMQSGVICHYMQGLNARCFLARTHKNISWATIFKLENLGLIKRDDKFVVLTEQGRSHCI